MDATGAGWLRLLALVAFVLAAAAAIPRFGPALGRVPWVPIGLALWVWADLSTPGGGFDLD
jgi:hypothetical protein